MPDNTKGLNYNKGYCIVDSYLLFKYDRMFSLVRKVVAGPKNTTTYEGEELDLTYITQRIIAMAFPASEFLEKTYRNPIEDVAAYFNQNHNNSYLIMNVSSRMYNYAAFDGRVKDYEWPDHQAPPLTTLIEIGYEMFTYLKGSPARVVAVHCNHGKGRTGTAIISFMILVREFQYAQECIKFNKVTYGVDQPCQLRYINFVEAIVSSPKIEPKLICYRLKGITQKGLNSDYFVKIQHTRTQEVLFEKVDFGVKISELEGNILVGDIFIEIYINTWKGSKKVARINYNMYFCESSNLQLTFKGKYIKLSDHHQDFQITLHLQYFCLCHLPTYSQSVCSCKEMRQTQETLWGKMIGHVKECKKMSKKDLEFLVHGIKMREGKHAQSQQKQIKKKQGNPVYRSFNSKKIRSARQQKLASLVHQGLQQRMMKQEVEEPVEKIKELSGSLEEEAALAQLKSEEREKL